MPGIKIVIVGEQQAGKTCFAFKSMKDTFPEVYVRTIFENYIVDMVVDGKTLTVSMWDTGMPKPTL